LAACVDRKDARMMAGFAQCIGEAHLLYKWRFLVRLIAENENPALWILDDAIDICGGIVNFALEHFPGDLGALAAPECEVEVDQFKCTRAEPRTNDICAAESQQAGGDRGTARLTGEHELVEP